MTENRAEIGHKHTKNNKLFLDRNSTNFPQAIFEYLKSRPKQHSKYGFLRYNQDLVRELFNNVNMGSRGILIYQEMGIGKSMQAIAIAMDQMRERQPILLMAKSLHDNMYQTIHKYIALRSEHDDQFPLKRMNKTEIDAWIAHNFSFVSMNAGNMMKQITKSADKSAHEIDATLDAKFGELLRAPSLDGKLLIVDEAHNWFRAITNGSANAIGLYDTVMKSRNIRLVFLTGTPIANDPFELVACFNMLAGKPIFPTNYSDFRKFFISRGVFINKEKFQNRIFGLVSHVNRFSTPGAAIGNKEGFNLDFPKENPLIIERVKMVGKQYTAYLLARDSEDEEKIRYGQPLDGIRAIYNLTPAMTKPKSQLASTYRVKSRQLGNFYPLDPSIKPESWDSPKFLKIYENMTKHAGEHTLVYSQFTGRGGTGSFRKFLIKRGWREIKFKKRSKNPMVGGHTFPHPGADKESFSKYLLSMSHSFESDMYSKYIKDGGDDSEPGDASVKPDDVEGKSKSTDKYAVDKPGLTHDEEKPKDAILPPGLETEDMPSNDTQAEDISGDQPTTNNEENESDDEDEQPNEDGPKFAVINGTVDSDIRAQIQEVFNSTDNFDGSKCQLLIISATGAEGLDLKRIRSIHIMEPYWNMGRIYQVIARAVRSGSHADLPEKDKVVQPYIYLALEPDGDVSEHLTNQAITTDIELFDSAMRDNAIINEFNEALKEVAIECAINMEPNCRICHPDNKPMTTDNIRTDVRGRDPCGVMNTMTIKAKKIEHNGNKYYYRPNPSSIFSYSVFKFDESVNGHRAVRENDAEFEGIIAEIEKVEKNTQS